MVPTRISTFRKSSKAICGGAAAASIDSSLLRSGSWRGFGARSTPLSRRGGAAGKGYDGCVFALAIVLYLFLQRCTPHLCPSPFGRGNRLRSRCDGGMILVGHVA